MSGTAGDTAVAYLDLHHDAPVAMLDHEVTDRRAWTRDGVSAADWTVPLPEAALVELRGLAASLARQPLPVLVLSPEDFTLPACRAAIARIRSILDDGIGVAVLDRLPLDDLSAEAATAAHWVLGQLLAPAVAQKWDGSMVYDVTDTGRTFGYGVRGSWTNVELSFHTDNAFGAAPPDYVGLLCLMPAREGGISRFASLYTVHNEMRRRHPRELARLYRPMFYDRQAEHAPGEPRVLVDAVLLLRRRPTLRALLARPREEGLRAHADAARRGDGRRPRRPRRRARRSAPLDGVHDRARPDPVPQQP